MSRPLSPNPDAFLHGGGSPVLAAWLARYARWLVLVPVLLATATRFYALDHASLWADELWGVDACSQGSWWAMVTQMILKDSHPPGYQTMLYGWMQLFGDGDATVRLPSVIAGILTVLALYQFAARFFTPLLGLVAATGLAVSYHAIYYSQEARAYEFLLLFAIWHWHLLFLLFQEKQQQLSNWLAFWAVGVLMVYFHYVGSVMLASEALVVVLLPAWRPPWRTVLRAFLPIVLLYLPWLPVMLDHILHPDQQWETPTPGWSILVETARFIWGPASEQFYLAFSLFCGFLCVVWHRCRHAKSTADRQLLVVLLLVALPWCVFFVKSHVSESAYTVRHFIFVIPAVMLVLARMLLWGLARVHPNYGPGWLGSVLLVLVWGSVSLNVADDVRYGGKLYSGITKQEYREAAALIAQDDDFMRGEKRHVFISNLFFDHYLQKQRVRFKPARFMHAEAPEKLPEYLQFIRERKMQDFYYLEVFQDVSRRERQSSLLQALRQQYHTVCATRFFWVQVWKFNTQRAANPADALQSCPRSVPGLTALPVGTGPVMSPVVPSPATTP